MTDYWEYAGRGWRILQMSYTIVLLQIIHFLRQFLWYFNSAQSICSDAFIKQNTSVTSLSLCLNQFFEFQTIGGWNRIEKRLSVGEDSYNSTETRNGLEIVFIIRTYYKSHTRHSESMYDVLSHVIECVKNA